jgi:two-component system, OmpR family, sensor histidine kinase CiaH
MFSRARLRLTLWFAGVFAVILLVIGVAVLFTARTAIYDQVEDDLQARANPLLRSLARPFNPERGTLLDFATAGGYFYAITGPNGGQVEASPGIEGIELPPLEELEEEAEDGSAYVDAKTTEGEDLKLYVQPVSDVQGNTYYFQVGRSIEPEQEAMQRLVVVLAGGGIIGLILGTAGGYWVAGLALRPIQTSVRTQRTFVADASHELRTPLSLIRANAEIIKRNPDEPPDQMSVNDIIKETDRLSYLVGQMLTLARSDVEHTTIEREPVPIGRVAEGVARSMRLLAAEKAISLSVTGDVSAIVSGDEQRLSELLIILLDNAIKYSDEGGNITVSLVNSGKVVRIEVADTGRGIAPEALPHVFDRFYRADRARSREMGGTGLGLAIGKWIVDAHGGRIDIKSTPGVGTTVRVELPAETEVFEVDETDVVDESGGETRASDLATDL